MSRTGGSPPSSEPGAVRIERDARLREALVQRDDRLDLLLAAQHAALQLEVVEAVARVRGLGQPHDRLGRQRLLVAQAQPVVAAVGVARVRQVGLRRGRRRRTGSRASRPASRCWPSPSSAATGTPRCWPSRSSSADSIAVTAWIVVRRSKVCRPRPPASRSANCVRTSLQHRLHARRSAGRRRAARASSSVWRIFSPPGTSPTPVWPALSVRISEVAREERAVRAAQVEQHAVAAGDGNDAQFGQRRSRCVRGGHRGIFEGSPARSIGADLRAQDDVTEARVAGHPRAAAGAPAAVRSSARTGTGRRSRRRSTRGCRPGAPPRSRTPG